MTNVFKLSKSVGCVNTDHHAVLFVIDIGFSRHRKEAQGQSNQSNAAVVQSSSSEGEFAN
jgi:hypothetical protein